mgnify:CR=1 FL=1
MLTDSRTKLQIKGIRDGLLVTIGEGDWEGVQAALLTHIEERIGFFKGARLALDVSNRIMHAAEMGTLRDRLSDKGVALWAVLSSSPVTYCTPASRAMARAPALEMDSLTNFIVTPTDTRLTNKWE